MKILDEVFCSQPLDVWRARLDQHAVTFGIIARIDDLPSDPQLVANGIFRPVEGRGVREGLRTVDSPIQLDRHPKPPAGRAPEPGEHGRELLASLGYTAERIDGLVRSRGAEGLSLRP